MPNNNENRELNSNREDIRSLPDPLKTTKALIQAALDSGGPDNISVIVVSIEVAQGQMPGSNVQLFTKPDSVHLPQM